MKKREFCKLMLDIIDEWEEENFDGLIEEAVCNEDWFELVHMIHDRVKGRQLTRDQLISTINERAERRRNDDLAQFITDSGLCRRNRREPERGSSRAAERFLAYLSTCADERREIQRLLVENERRSKARGRAALAKLVADYNAGKLRRGDRGSLLRRRLPFSTPGVRRGGGLLRRIMGGIIGGIMCRRDYEPDAMRAACADAEAACVR